MTLLLAINPGAILIGLLIIALFLLGCYVIITKLVPAEYKNIATAILFVLVIIVAIYWLMSLGPNPFG